MTKLSVRRSVRPTLEALEDRCTPAGTVTGSLAGHVWTLTGDGAANNVKVASAGTPGAFTVTGGGTTLAGVTTPTGVKVIVFDMQGGNDKVDVNGAKLKNMIFNGGDGDNTFTAKSFKLTNKLQVVNGVGGGSVSLMDFKTGGNVNINNGSGGSETFMGPLSAAAGFNNIAGNLNITNGAGVDYTQINDTNVGGNITVNNGAGAGAGTLQSAFGIFNDVHTGRRAVVGGNIKVTFQDGNSGSSISDTVVRGNVLFNNGSGAAKTYFDGYKTTLPVLIQGRLKIVGTGTNLVSIGRQFQFKHTGLKVGHNLVIDVVNPADLTLEAFNLVVNGQTKII